MKILKILMITTVLGIQSCKTQTQKINGVSFVASRELVNQSHIKPISNVHANYASVMPFGFIRSLEHPEIIYNTQRQWFGETSIGARQYIEELRKQSIKIMLKPQIWVRGVFTGDIKMNNEEDWKTLEQSYSKFILEYTKLAKEQKVEIFCIGTEWDEFIKNRPEYWRDLISKIKSIYKGKLTYASNWNEFGRTPFWRELDYIGIDAYFPLSDEKTPSTEQCLEGWKRHKPSIKALSDKLNKPIMFTEYGYRSVDYSAKEPWKSDREMNQVNMEAQKNAKRALFEMFWHEDWFAGGFVWKWFHNHEIAGGDNNSRFTPQNKPVQEVIKEYYLKFSD